MGFMQKVRSIKNGAKILLSIISTLVISLVINKSEILYSSDDKHNWIFLDFIEFFDWDSFAIRLQASQLIFFTIIFFNYWFFWGLKKD
jgi:hypothetical protein